MNNPNTATKRILVGLTLTAEPGKRIFVAGSFNRWRPDDIPMNAIDNHGLYLATMTVEQGLHQYKFIVDGQWQPDPNNPLRTPDGMGGANSVLHV